MRGFLLLLAASTCGFTTEPAIVTPGSAVSRRPNPLSTALDFFVFINAQVIDSVSQTEAPNGPISQPPTPGKSTVRSSKDDNPND